MYFILNFLHIIGSISNDIDCHEPGIDYRGNDLNDGGSTLTDSSKECQTLCKNNPACVGFTWVISHGNCWLKSVMANKLTNGNAVSGPKHCGMLILNNHSNLQNSTLY